MHHQIDHVLAAGLPGGPARQVLAEDRRQRRRVREVEIAEPGNRDIEVYGVDPFAEYAGLDALAEDGRNQADQRRMHRLQLARAAHVPGAPTIFVVQQHDEVRVRGEVIEGTLYQFLDRLFGRQSLEVELALLGADLLIDPFEYRQIQRILVTEVVIDELLVDARARGDLVDPGAGKAAAGELAPCRRQQFPAGCGRIAPLRLGIVDEFIGHFQPNS